MGRLALFDLDHTLLSGDSDVLWCEFLMASGRLPRAEFEVRNDEMARRYAQGAVSPEEFCSFYVSTLTGWTPSEIEPWCKRFLNEVIAPRIPPSSRALVETHRSQGDTLVLTTATNRVLTSLTAVYLDIGNLIATEAELVDGRYTGCVEGSPNMREGKVSRIHAWLRQRGRPQDDLSEASFYSDSANDLALLRAVGRPVAVDPDPTLRDVAFSEGWTVLELNR